MSKSQKPTTSGTSKPSPKPPHTMIRTEGGVKNGQVPRMENPPKPPTKKSS